MKNKQRILILSGDLGDGHKQAANALLEASAIYAPEAEVQVLDFMELVSPRLHLVSKYIYLKGVDTFPRLYGYLFDKTREHNKMSQLLKKIAIFGISHLFERIQSFHPSIVVSTFPAAAATMSILKENEVVKIPSVTVITDHTDHSYWIHTNTDLYIVGSDPVKRALLRQHVADAKITVTGIPVKSSFCQSYNPVSLREKFGLSLTKPTILIMGGGCGMMGDGVLDMLRSDHLQKPMQFIIVCGRNEKLRAHLELILKYSKHHMVLTGFVDNIHEWMALSDLIITKPGGLTTSEAIASELPMLLYRPLPGQEKDNAEVLVQAGVALYAKEDHDLLNLLEQCFEHPQLLMSMRAKAKQICMRHASKKAVEAILRVEQRSSEEIRLWLSTP